jgi:hypothetical protein
MTTSIQTVRTTSEIQNPKFDGRVKEGLRSIKVFSVGTIFEIDKGNAVEMEDPTVKLRGDSWHVVNFSFIKEILAGSEVFEPKNYDELLFANGYKVGVTLSGNPDLGAKILQKLLDNGTVDMHFLQVIINEIEE